jgi:Coenzyme PQQ synthesis protein D (PqqD)
MDSPGWYRVDPRKVAHETIDGEVIMIHLLIGSYYSLRGAGADIWDSLASGRDRAQTLAFLEQRYEGDPQLIAETVDDLAKELEKEELLEPAADGANGANGAPPAAVAERKPFEVPALEKYTDMQDFLLVDPIHETDETGWPSTNQAAG